MNIFIAHIESDKAVLTPEESWHCSKVLRNRVGDKIKLIDGQGNFYSGTLSVVTEKKCEALITEGPVAQKKRNYYLHLAIAPTKKIDRIEWMIEKAVEIGIDELSFVICKNSERTVIKTERIQKIVESAVKQSLQAYIPKINEASDFKQVVNSSTNKQKFIAHCFDGAKTSIQAVAFKNLSSLVLIGPEGDFTREEVLMAETSGFTGLALGDNRLRTETAGLYVCQAASILSLT